METRTALLIGATGLVGGHLLELLLDDPRWSRVTVLARRVAERRHAKLEWREVDFERPASFGELAGLDDVFCALGTTIRRAGSRDAFRRIDEGYTVTVAGAARARGASQLALVSAVGADATSSIFYNRVKGELEAALRALGYPRLRIARPSLLLGERRESRPGEQVGGGVMRALGWMMVGPLVKYRAIAASEVARALCAAAKIPDEGVIILEGDALASSSRSELRRARRL
jgi:uncharacterized protein YbjT (DUF2867 family)